METPIAPGSNVRFTQSGRKGERAGILNGYTESNHGTVAHVRIRSEVVSVPADRIRPLTAEDVVRMWR